MRPGSASSKGRPKSSSVSESLSPSADRAIELEMRERPPELVEAELAAKLRRIEVVGGLTRVAVLHVLQHQVHAVPPGLIAHGFSWTAAPKCPDGRIEPCAKRVGHRGRRRIGGLCVDRDGLAAEHRRQLLACAFLPDREPAEHVAQVIGQRFGALARVRVDDQASGGEAGRAEDGVLPPGVDRVARTREVEPRAFAIPLVDDHPVECRELREYQLEGAAREREMVFQCCHFVAIGVRELHRRRRFALGGGELFVPKLDQAHHGRPFAARETGRAEARDHLVCRKRPERRFMDTAEYSDAIVDDHAREDRVAGREDLRTHDLVYEAPFPSQEVDRVHTPAVLDAEHLPDARVGRELELDPRPIACVEARSLRVQEVCGEWLACDRPRIRQERLDELPRDRARSERVLRTARDGVSAEAACAEREHVCHDALVPGVERGLR